ncbi:unnamed protein product [Nippostrongylus brasiliensis]|uniref:Uncharacterized protein n=1 Tax=Nippostrongylus brasiliensis TaxID=27835 RepID=A0A0N4Y358_NIPBR|nr:unnamed protein product [Nippostrongylus brasiliensis]
MNREKIQRRHLKKSFNLIVRRLRLEVSRGKMTSTVSTRQGCLTRAAGRLSTLLEEISAEQERRVEEGAHGAKELRKLIQEKRSELKKEEMSRTS